jgi:hypothetical protein
VSAGRRIDRATGDYDKDPHSGRAVALRITPAAMGRKREASSYPEFMPRKIGINVVNATAQIEERRVGRTSRWERETDARQPARVAAAEIFAAAKKFVGSDPSG